MSVANPVGAPSFARLCAITSVAAALCAPLASAAQADLDALVKAAKAEGTVTMYVGYTENIGKRTVDAFNAKYGMNAQFVRMDAVPLLQRYSSEAQAGNIAADLIINAGGSDRFAEQGVKNGWMEPIAEAGIPVIRSREFPAQFNRGRTAVVQIVPWILAYHTEKVKGADVPRDWADLLKPKWKGQILVFDPSISDAYLDFWAALMDKLGPSFFSRLRANIRVSSVPQQAMQALGAGEGAFLVPVVIGQVQGVKAKGAPVDTVTMDLTSGVVMQIMLTARAKAKHPNAARLFANYILSPEGNKVVNSDPGNFTLYDTSKLPKQYEAPKIGTAARREELKKALGF